MYVFELEFDTYPRFTIDSDQKSISSTHFNFCFVRCSTDGFFRCLKKSKKFIEKFNHDDAGGGSK